MGCSRNELFGFHSNIYLSIVVKQDDSINKHFSFVLDSMTQFLWHLLIGCNILYCTLRKKLFVESETPFLLLNMSFINDHLSKWNCLPEFLLFPRCGASPVHGLLVWFWEKSKHLLILSFCVTSERFLKLNMSIISDNSQSVSFIQNNSPFILMKVLWIPCNKFC